MEILFFAALSVLLFFAFGWRASVRGVAWPHVLWVCGALIAYPFVSEPLFRVAAGMPRALRHAPLRFRAVREESEMHTHRRFLFALLLIAFPSAVQGRGPGYWLIGQVTGRWEYRLAQGEALELTGKYDYLVPAGEVRCLEADLRGCELRFLSDPPSGANQETSRPTPAGRPLGQPEEPDTSAASRDPNHHGRSGGENSSASLRLAARGPVRPAAATSRCEHPFVARTLMSET